MIDKGITEEVMDRIEECKMNHYTINDSYSYVLEPILEALEEIYMLLDRDAS